MNNAMLIAKDEQKATAVPAATPMTVKDKWQGAVNQNSGFVAIPVALLRLQTKYGLSQTEMMVLINLLAHWWEPGRGAFPRSSIIAGRLGVTKRTVQRAMEKLETLGFMSRDTDSEGRRVVAFDGLVTRLARDTLAAAVIQVDEGLRSKTE